MYTIVTGKENISVYSDYSEKNIEPGQSGIFTIVTDGRRSKCTKFINKPKIYEKIYKKIYDSLHANDRHWLIEDDVTACLKHKGIELIKHIITSKKTGSKIFIRFDNDADGITGGLALRLLLGNVLNYQNKGAVYTPGFAMNDISLLTSSNRPILIITDSGSSSESKEGLELVKSAGIETIIIDHHPYDEKPVVDHYLSPWDCGGNSMYPAGYILCELVKHFIDNDQLTLLSTVSLAGDKSALYTVTEKDKKYALTLDYLATYSRFPNTLSFYSNVLKDNNLLCSISLMAEEKLESIRKSAKHYTKEKKFGNLKVILLQVDKITLKHDFPSKSKAAGTVFEMYEDPVVLIAYGKKLITMRVSKSAQKTVSAREIIKIMKQKFHHAILSGGGHDAAASMRCEPEMMNIIIEEIVKLIEQNQKK